MHPWTMRRLGENLQIDQGDRVALRINGCGEEEWPSGHSLVRQHIMQAQQKLFFEKALTKQNPLIHK